MEVHEQRFVEVPTRFLLRYGNIRVSIRAMITPLWVHAWASFIDVVVTRWGVRCISGWDPALNRPQIESEAVRSLARELLDECGRKDVVIGYARKIPTLKNKIEKEARMGVSFAHHGDFVAAAIAGWRSAPDNISDANPGTLQQKRMGEMCSTFTA